MSGLAFGTALIASYERFESQIYEWMAENIGLLTSHPELPFLISLIVVSPLYLFSIYLFIYGHRAAKAKRLPAPGYSVVRDTLVHTGTDAVYRARIVQVLSLVLVLPSAMIPVFFWYVFSRLAGDA